MPIAGTLTVMSVPEAVAVTPGPVKLIDVTAPLPEHMRKTWSFFGFAAKPERDPFADR